MKFFDYIRKFLMFTIKETYSFFLKLGLFILIFFLFSVSVTTFFSSKLKVGDKAKPVSKNYSYVLFNPVNVTEDKLIGKGLFGTQKKYNVSFTDILNSLENIRHNKNIKGIIIDLDNVQLSSSKTEEVLKKMHQVKESGKKIYAFGSYIQNFNYSLASVADEIVMIPSASATVSLTGYHYSSLYYKGLLDKLGVTMEVIRIGDFKSYGENFTSDKISDGLKDELTRILDNRYNNFVDSVSQYRKIDRNNLNSSILNGDIANITPFTARDRGLIDKLESFGDFTARLGITEKNIADIYDYYEKNQSVIDNEKSSGPAIAVIYAEGAINYEESSANEILISPNTIAKKIEKAMEVKDLRGVVLRVNSPGGSALASEIIYQSLLSIRKKAKIPIYVSMSESAASGGYYISMAGEKVFANKATITGSIGVVSMIPKLYNAQNKYGISSNAISKGKFSDAYDAFSPISDDTRSRIVSSMNSTYNEFKSRVTQNRKISDSELENYAQGKIWLGDEAKNIRLVDGIASLEETVALLAGDLSLGKNYSVKNIYSEVNFEDSLKILSSFITEKIGLSAKLPVEVKIFDEYKMIEKNQNRPMYYLPYSIEMY